MSAKVPEARGVVCVAHDDWWPDGRTARDCLLAQAGGGKCLTHEVISRAETVAFLRAKAGEWRAVNEYGGHDAAAAADGLADALEKGR